MIASSTVPSFNGAFKASSNVVALAFKAAVATSLTKVMNFSFLATKSVSELISQINA